MNQSSDRLVTLFSLILTVTAAACGSDSEDVSPSADAGGADSTVDAGASWECEASRNGWERCNDNRVQYCHIVTGMDPHFHWGADCVSLGLTCVEVDGSNAACVDNNTPCTVADERCAENVAYFCVGGKLAQEPCGTARECHDTSGTPRCEDKSTECGGNGHLDAGACVCDSGYVVDPDNATNCISEVGFPQLACNDFAGSATPEAAVSDFASFEDAHVELDQPYQIALPANAAGYVHFPVTRSGEYVVFLSDAGVFDALMNRNGQDLSPSASGGVANAKCADSIKDHWHASLVFDAPVGQTPIPYVVRFKAVASPSSVKVLIKRNDAEAPAFPLASCDMFRASHTSESVVTSFQDFKNAHANLDQPYDVTLPDNAPAYLHFPVKATGEYVIFLSDPDRFDAFVHRSGTDVSPAATGGVGNGSCGELIQDHWHGSLTFDGAATDTVVPYIVRFKAVAGGGKVSFLIREKGE